VQAKAEERIKDRLGLSLDLGDNGTIPPHLLAAVMYIIADVVTEVLA
jgi:hypothetical protein